MNEESSAITSFKVVMLGEANVGKTCIVNRYLKNSFTADNMSTIGSNFSSKQLDIKPAGCASYQKVKLQIWDTAGGEQFRSLVPMYYKNASAVCLIYDSTSKESFEQLAYWVKELENRSDKNVHINVVASKIDDDEREEVPLKKAAEYSTSIGAHFHQTSAKDGTGIDKLFTDTAHTLYTKMLAGETEKDDEVDRERT